jgi:allophanate hydrolase
LVAEHRSGRISVADTLARTLARIRTIDDPAIFITLREKAALLSDAQSLLAKNALDLPLFGVPVAVKDNIDVAGLPTTAACPAFSYVPSSDATAIASLKRAGAIIIGKTNLDQFATGLVGTRSPYGTPRNPLKADLIPGGSSSGSAVAVAQGIVPLALGTDTAGSGRVPAALNNIVGLKPSLGLVSTTGIVPACRSLDCISIFALTVGDAFAALQAIAAPDEADPYSRPLSLGPLSPPPPQLRLGVPRVADRFFLGSRAAEAAFEQAERIVSRSGASLKDIDLTPFFEAAKLLYEGPWVAERTAAVGDFIASRPGDVHPVTRAIISQGAGKSAVDAFRGQHRLAELRAEARRVLSDIDMLMVPTVPSVCSISEVEADPIGLNSKLGTYTNFVNLLDLAALAVPVSLAGDGVPFGVTLLAPAGRDAQIAAFGALLHPRFDLPLGALGAPQPPLPPLANGPMVDEVAIAVVGAHLSGMPLNHELRALGGRFLEATSTGEDYQLFALDDAEVRRPGLLRVPDGTGVAIELEIWALPIEGFGRFVAAVPPPLAIGSIRLSDGRLVKGFLAEAQAVTGARNISSFGSWRAFVAAQGADQPGR